jgi:hypothetical protein
VIVTLKELVTGAHPEIKPFIMSVKVPVEVTPDQSYYLEDGEKITAVGLAIETSL